MKRQFSFRLLTATGLLCGLLLVPLTNAEPSQFALVAKRVDHPFFIQAGEGCAEAAQAKGDTCLLLGASGVEHFRLQNQALEQALDRGLDGIALSVTHSKWLAEHALQRMGKMPLITFEADFEPAERYLRRGYVGLDNRVFGQQLGLLAQQLRPQGGYLCVLNGSMRENNYQERLQGIREQLRGSETQVEVRAADRLSGENGWSEPNRCPLFRAEKPEKAVFQLVALLKAQKVDVIISTGSWPIYHADVFRQQLSPLLAELDKKGKRPTIIIASNEPDAAKRALLDDGLIQAYLSLEGREIGRQSYRILKRLAQGESVPEKVFVDSRIYLPKVSTAIPIAPREGVSQ